MNNSSIQSPLLRLIDQRLLCALCLLGVVSACGGAATQQAPIHRPGPDLSGYYATRTPGQLAYGRDQGFESSTPQQGVSIEDYLKPEAVANAYVRKQRAAETTQHVAAAPALPVHVASAPAPVQAAPEQTAAPIELASASTEADAQRYASRETQAKKQEQYRGGDVIVISATTIIIVLLIVLIIMLLT